MGKLFVTGDVHGDVIDRFTFRKNAFLRELDENDIMVVLGDFGIPFGVKGNWSLDADKYDARWLSQHKWTTVAIAGNHDDRDAIAEMPLVEKFGGKVRQLAFCGETYDNIYYVDTPQILVLNGKKCLCIPGAESHDIDILLDPEDDGFERKCREFQKKYIHFRVKHWSWWEDEAINVKAANKLVEQHIDEKFDLILTHDAPALINKYLGFEDTEGESFLDSVRRVVEFDEWFHGHYHLNFYSYRDDPRITCLYRSILEV